MILGSQICLNSLSILSTAIVDMFSGVVSPHERYGFDSWMIAYPVNRRSPSMNTANQVITVLLTAGGIYVHIYDSRWHT